MHCVITDQKLNRADDVVKCDPAHPLFPVAEASTDAHTKRRQHLRQCAAVFGENYAEPRQYGADSLLRCGRRRFFPLLTNVGQKVVTGCAGFSQQLIATVAIVANCRSTQENRGRVAQCRQCFAQQAGACDAAIENGAFFFAGPTALGNVLACKVDHNVEAFEMFFVDETTLRIPTDFKPAVMGLMTHQTYDFMAGRGQRLYKGAADESMRTADEDLHCCVHRRKLIADST